MFAAVEVLLLNQSASVTDMVIPSKLLTYMAAGRPVVAAVTPSSEAAQCIRRAGCGLVVEPENPPALAQAIRRLHGDRELAARLGRQGRLFAERHFASDRILQCFENLFLSVLEKQGKKSGALAKYAGTRPV
jgi:glycosyltransferase involved in cell wall biosynthesis